MLNIALNIPPIITIIIQFTFLIKPMQLSWLDVKIIIGTTNFNQKYTPAPSVRCTNNSIQYSINILQK